MKSQLFEQGNLEVEGQHRFGLQNPQMLRVALGPDVLAVKGSMVAFQGQVQFHHEKAGGMGKLLKKVLTSEDMPLMRVAGQGEVFFANEGGYVYLVDLDGDGISVNGRNLLAFDATLEWDINRVKGAGMMAGGLFNTTVSGSGTVALCTVGHPVVLDCSSQPTYVDVQAAVAWSSTLVAQRGLQHELQVAAARRHRRGLPVRLPRTGLRGRPALRVRAAAKSSGGSGAAGSRHVHTRPGPAGPGSPDDLELEAGGPQRTHQPQPDRQQHLGAPGRREVARGPPRRCGRGR